MPENHKSLSFFYFFEKKKKKIGPAWSLAHASDPAGHKRGAILFCEQSKMHAKRPCYCSSELKFTWTVQTQSRKMHAARGEEKTDLGTEAKKLQRRWKRDGWSVFVCFKSFPRALYLRLFFWFFFPLCLRHSLSNGFLHFLLPFSVDFMCRKMKQRPTSCPCLFMASLLFHFFSSSFSSTACLPNLTVVQEWKKETPSVLCFFFLS